MYVCWGIEEDSSLTHSTFSENVLPKSARCHGTGVFDFGCILISGELL
jgi:hypothetical protein